MVTLQDPSVLQHLHQHHVVAWSNLLPELYGNSDPNAAPPASYDPRVLSTTPEGAGGGNVRAYFCTPDGRIVHLVVGYWKPERFLAEADFAAELARDPSHAAAAHARRRGELQRAFDEAKAALPPTPTGDALRPLTRAALRLRAATELAPDLLADIDSVLDRRREEVYTKGALG